MTFQALATDVINPDLCAQCGLCEAVCPEGLISCRDDTKIPLLRDHAKVEACGACNLCAEVCPGAEPDTPRSELELFGRTRRDDERWLGITEEILGGRAGRADMREASASGGGVTALAAETLRLGLASAVLACGRESARPWRAQPVLCTNEDDLIACAQATYQLSPHLSALREVLQSPRSSARIAVVGLACHIQAIRKLQRHPSQIGRRARQRIGGLIEIACSSNTLPKGTETFIEAEMGIALDNVANVKYRDNGYPGEFAVVTKSGTRRAEPVWRAIRHFKDFKTHRCLSCGDWLSGLADISICDGDPNIFISSQDAGLRREKYGSIIVRTDLGARIVAQARESGRLEAWSSAVAEDLHLGLLRKRNRRAFYEGQQVAVPAGPIPDYHETISPIDDDALVANPAEAKIGTRTGEGAEEERWAREKPPVRLDMCTEADLNAISPRDILLVPFGSFEPHGHLPLGTDRLICEAILTEVARRGTGLWLFPAFPVGFNFKYRGWPGSVGVSSHTLADIVESIARDASRFGLRRLFVMSGHDENREATVTGLREIEYSTGTRSIYCDWLDLAVTLARQISTSRSEGHASEIQTSMVQFLLPGQNYAPIPPAKTVQTGCGQTRHARDGHAKAGCGKAGIALGADDLFAEPESGEWIRSVDRRPGQRSLTGDPTYANAAKGQMIFERIVTRTLELTSALGRLDLGERP
ncbi:creatininase family protein [Breoghania sp. JC706]|uniref:creatininase family protein n=1 Tax=Breoghania sp. JC706 TaxID=3117732 RepID=UPI003009C249